MSDAKIGCVGVVHNSVLDQYLGIQCAKGRGIIFPGGKYEHEKDRTFKATAKRELREETGVHSALDGLFLGTCLALDGYTQYFYYWEYDECNFTQMGPTIEGVPDWYSKMQFMNQSCVFTPNFDLVFDWVHRLRKLHLTQ